MSSKPVTILLVEDNDVDAEAIERAFQKQRIANPMVRARDGVDALAYLRGTDGHKKLARPHIILLDLNMPRMGGLDFLQELRADEGLTDSVVFVLTTSKADEDRVAAYKEHVAGYIVKNEAGRDFLKLTEMLDRYWRVVELPNGGA